MVATRRWPGTCHGYWSDYGSPSWRARGGSRQSSLQQGSCYSLRERFLALCLVGSRGKEESRRAQAGPGGPGKGLAAWPQVRGMEAWV